MVLLYMFIKIRIEAEEFYWLAAISHRYISMEAWCGQSNHLPARLNSLSLKKTNEEEEDGRGINVCARSTS